MCLATASAPRSTAATACPSWLATKAYPSKPGERREQAARAGKTKSALREITFLVEQASACNGDFSLRISVNNADFNLDGLPPAAEGDSFDGSHIAIVAAPSHRNVAVGRHYIVCGIEAQPAS